MNMPADSMSDDHIAANIRRARLRRGLTQTALARRLGVKQPAVAQWENGQSLPEIKTRIALARFLDIPLAQVGIPIEDPWRMPSLQEEYLALDPAGRELVEKGVELLNKLAAHMSKDKK